VSVVVVGLNHRSAPLDVLEAVAVGDASLPKALHDLTGRPNLSEVVVVSTCMRTEVYATVGRFHGALGDIRMFLAEWSGLAPEALSDYLYDYYAEAAVRHVLRVASGLDSAVLGEGEVLRQVRNAFSVARQEDAVGPTLGLLGRHALETGKRVRTDTAIARGTTSLSHTALSLAGSVGAPLDTVPPEASGCPVIGHGAVSADTAGLPGAAPGAGASVGSRPAGRRPTAEPPWEGGEASGAPCTWSSLLTGRSVLVVGAGEMGRAVATLAAGAPEIGPITVANRTQARADELAAQIGASVVAWDGVPVALAHADIVVVSTASTELVLDADTVESAVEERTSTRPLVIIDLSVPRNVAPDVASIPGVVLFDVTHLKAHAEAAMEGRRGEVPAAEEIVTEEVQRLTTVANQRNAAPLVVALRERGEEIRRTELAKVQSRLGDLDERQSRAVEALTKGIVAKLLHEPTVNLKVAVGDGDGDLLADAVQRLFDL
jgi:glutamyl-tRNA reductase